MTLADVKILNSTFQNDFWRSLPRYAIAKVYKQTSLSVCVFFFLEPRVQLAAGAAATPGGQPRAMRGKESERAATFNPRPEEEMHLHPKVTFPSIL